MTTEEGCSTFTIPVRPEGIYQDRHTLSEPTTNNRWELVYSRTYPFVDSVTLHNESSQTLRWSSKKNPSMGKYDTLASKSYITFLANPLEIWCKRTSDVGSDPTMVVDSLYWTEEQIEITMSWWKRLFTGIFSFLGPRAVEEEKKIPIVRDVVKIEPYSDENLNGGDPENVKAKKIPFILPFPFPLIKKEA